MAYTSGTATDYKDLLAAMVTFATANGWTALEQSETKVYLKGTGLAGLDEIYCGVETYEVPVSNIYLWMMNGSIGYRSGRANSKHPHNSYRWGSEYVCAYLWNTSIPYWMVANGRRIIVVAKVATTYHTIHLGLLSPPATDAQYPYPLLIGGGGDSLSRAYSSTMVVNFWALSGVNYDPGRLFFPGGQWGTQGTTVESENLTNPGFYVDSVFSTYVSSILTGLDGSYMLDPIYVVESQGVATLGSIEGLSRISGYNNTSENIVTVDGVNHICFQDVYRNGYGDFCALRMT